VALLDSIMPLMGWVAANLLIGGQEPVAMGNDNFTAAPSGTSRRRTATSHRGQQQEQWSDGRGDRRPGAQGGPPLKERDERKRNRKALTPLVEEKLKTKPTAFWVEALNARDVPSGDIPRSRTPSPAPGRAPQGAALRQGGRRDRRGEAVRPDRADVEDAGGDHLPPAALGAHTEEVLLGLGYTKQDVAGLKEKGIV